MKTKAYQITISKVASAVVLAATWVFTFAVLGAPLPEKRTDDGTVSASAPVSAALPEEKLSQASGVTPPAATQVISIPSAFSMVMTGLAVAALVVPFGLSSISLLCRTRILGYPRVRGLAEPVSGQLDERQDPGVVKPVFAGVE